MKLYVTHETAGTVCDALVCEIGFPLMISVLDKISFSKQYHTVQKTKVIPEETDCVSAALLIKS